MKLMRLCELFALILLANQVRQTRFVSVIKVCSIQLMRRWEFFALILALFALVWYSDNSGAKLCEVPAHLG